MCLLHSIKNEDEPTGKTDWSDMPGFDSKPFTDAEITKALADVFNGKIDPDNLPIDTYNKTGEILTRGAVEGISNEQLLGLGAVPDQLFFDALQDNAFKFAGAKTLDETRKLSDALVDENGNARNWSQFKKAAYSIVDNHRDNWLKAEYNNALSSAQMASKWEDLTNDDDFPYLKYVTAGDGRVRGEHARLNGTTLPKEHTFWSNFYPPNGWNCRCSVIKMSDLLEEYGEKVTPQSKIPRIEQPDEFNINVGTHRVLYSPKHDYFAVGKQYQSVLDALPEPGAKGGEKRVKIKEVVKPKVVKGFKVSKRDVEKHAIKNRFAEKIDYSRLKTEGGQQINERFAFFKEKYNLIQLKEISGNIPHPDAGGMANGKLMYINKAVFEEKKVGLKFNKEKFNRFSVADSYNGKKYSQTIIDHEIGHVIADQVFGQINGKPFLKKKLFGQKEPVAIKKLKEKPQLILKMFPDKNDAKIVRAYVENYEKTKEWDRLFRKYRNSKKAIDFSEYAFYEPGEFFAESFAMMQAGEKLPDDISLFIKEL
jgi:SPP1 gp7 family putative phage head morphogenesis protein